MWMRNKHITYVISKIHILNSVIKYRFQLICIFLRMFFRVCHMRCGRLMHVWMVFNIIEVFSQPNVHIITLQLRDFNSFKTLLLSFYNGDRWFYRCFIITTKCNFKIELRLQLSIYIWLYYIAFEMDRVCQ